MWLSELEDGCIRIHDYNGNRIADAMNINSAILFMNNYRKYECREYKFITTIKQTKVREYK